ncbi:hypothetical protein [Sulfitobacter sp. MF3-043]|uniref:hypothetical protein n=1 Tax=Sulfitobacter sediminivivens TaxID=3252902 RepID=UPI0036DA6B10
MTDKVPATPKKTRVRISDEMRKCIELMASEGLPVHVAAERANITRDTAVRKMRKAHVLRLFNQRVKDVRDNASQAAYMRINHLSVASTNERVKLDASKWVAGVDGISPVQKVQGDHFHRHVFGGFSYPDLEPVDVTPEDGD